MLPIVALLIVTAHNLHAASVTKKSMSMDYISFPDDGHIIRDSNPAKLQNTLGNRFGDNDVHESCKDLTYCTVKPANYPEKKFNEMFKDFKIPPLPVLDVFDNRQADPDFRDDCESVVTYEPLYVARTKREDAWRSVIQAPEHNYIQRVRLETCTNAGSSCFKEFTNDNPSFMTQCLQLENKWEVLVEDGNGTEMIRATLPVCCSCKYKRIDFFTRFNTDLAKESNKTKV